MLYGHMMVWFTKQVNCVLMQRALAKFFAVYEIFIPVLENLTALGTYERSTTPD